MKKNRSGFEASPVKLGTLFGIIASFSDRSSDPQHLMKIQYDNYKIGTEK
jgi:hypothetical protein